MFTSPEFEKEKPMGVVCNSRELFFSLTFGFFVFDVPCVAKSAQIRLRSPVTPN